MTDYKSPPRLRRNPTYLIAIVASAVAFLAAIILSVLPSAIHHKLLQVAISGFSQDGVITPEGIIAFNNFSAKIVIPATLAGGIFLCYAFIWRYIIFRLPVKPIISQNPLTSYPQSISSFEAYSFVLITTIGLIIRVQNITRGLEHDELITVMRFADVDSLWKTISSDHIFNNHVANSILTHLSLLTFGRAEWALRLPSLLIGLVTLYYFWIFARKFVRPEISLISVFFLAMSPIHVFYSASSRGYAGMILFTLVSVYLYFRLLDYPSLRNTVLFIVPSIIAVYFHLYSIIVIATQLLFLLFLAWIQIHGKPSNWNLSLESFNRISISIGIILILALIIYLPMLPQWVLNFPRVREGGFKVFFPLAVIIHYPVQLGEF